MDTRVNILLVDDEPRNLDALEAILEAPDHRFVRAQSADEALLAILRHDFAAIVLDIRMPGVSGLELAAMIKKRRRTQHIPILFLTAHLVEEQDVLQGYGVGAVDYLQKPINPEILRSKIAVFVDLFRKTHALAAANHALAAEIVQRQRAEDQLRHANEELEARVQERTANLLIANQALRESEQRLRVAVEVSRTIIVEIDLESRVVVGGPELADQLGLPPGGVSIPLQQLFQMVHAEDRGEVMRAVGRCLRFAGDRRFAMDHRLVRADGSVRWVDVRAQAYAESAPPRYRPRRIMAAMLDITARKQAELELREASAKFKSVFNQSGIFAAITDLQGFLREVNDLAVSAYGYSREDVLDRPFWQAPWWRGSEQVQARVRAATEHAARGEAFREELRYWLADGSERVLDFSMHPIRDSSGSVIFLHPTGVDVTDRKQVEAALEEHRERLEELVLQRTSALERSHERLRQAERLATVGTLATGLGHDMSNILLPIRARLESLGHSPLTPEEGADVAAIREAVGYLQRLSSALRLLAVDPDRAGEAEKGTDLAVWWREVEGLFRAATPRGVRLRGECDAGLPPVALSASRLTQVVFNLVQNAGEAIISARPDGGGQITISASLTREARDTETGEHAPGDPRSADRGVLLTVSDDGPGMSPDVSARCFEPYFSTKVRAVSTGMGLPMVRAMIEAVGGRIRVRTSPGAGATFQILLPGASVPPSSASGAPDALPRVALSLTDSRLAGFASAIIAESGAVAEPWDGDGIPHADVWVVSGAAAVPERVAAFIGDGSHRRAVALTDAPLFRGEPRAAISTLVDESLPSHAGRRVWYTGRQPSFSLLRQSLQQSLQSLSPPLAPPRPERVPDSLQPSSR